MLKGSLNLVASLLGPDHWDGLSAIDPALQPAAEHHGRAHVPESGPQHLAARNLCQEHKNIELWLYGIIYFVVMYFVYLNIITELNIESGVTQLLLKSPRNLLVLFPNIQLLMFFLSKVIYNCSSTLWPGLSLTSRKWFDFFSSICIGWIATKLTVFCRKLI